jgi:hypothetical protein
MAIGKNYDYKCRELGRSLFRGSPMRGDGAFLRLTAVSLDPQGE